MTTNDQTKTELNQQTVDFCSKKLSQQRKTVYCCCLRLRQQHKKKNNNSPIRGLLTVAVLNTTVLQCPNIHTHPVALVRAHSSIHPSIQSSLSNIHPKPLIHPFTYSYIHDTTIHRPTTNRVYHHIVVVVLQVPVVDTIRIIHSYKFEFKLSNCFLLLLTVRKATLSVHRGQ